jgi:outer membrane lipoprotein LolB
MKNIVLTCALFAIALFSSTVAMAEDSNTVILKREFINRNIEHPENDLQKNTDAGDFRFVCICDYACYAPGVEKGDMQLWMKYGHKCIEGTNDVIEGKEHGKLTRTARNYARRYNELLIGILKSKSEP